MTRIWSIIILDLQILAADLLAAALDRILEAIEYRRVEQHEQEVGAEFWPACVETRSRCFIVTAETYDMRHQAGTVEFSRN